MNADKPSSQNSNSQQETESSDAESKLANGYQPVKRLLVFQLKLLLDALRDILLSPISIIATTIDLIEGRKGQKSYFSLLLKYGRESERRINLFDQHSKKSNARNLDSVVQQVEDILVNEYKSGEISAKAKQAIQKSLRIKSQEEKSNADTE